MSTDDKLRAILRSEAEAVDPSAAGYDAIRRGIEDRSRRRWLLRSTALAGAALTVAGALFVVTRDDDSRSIVQPPAASGSATPSVPPSTEPSGSPVPVADPTPINAIWPLTTRGAVDRWNADHSTYPSLASPGGAALGFARGYLHVDDATVASVDVQGGSLFFEVRRPGDGVVTTVELRGFGDGGGAPYVAVAARHDGLTIETPATGATVTSPLHAHGTYRDVDPGINATLYQDSGGSTPGNLQTGHAVTGPPDVWDVSLTFQADHTTGSLLVTNGSKRDSGIAMAAAVPVVFATHVEPYVSIAGQRVAYHDGGEVRYLSAEAPGGGPSDPDLSPTGRRAAWVQGDGTCAASVRWVPVSGGAVATIPVDGVAFMPRWLDDTVLFYLRSDCSGGLPVLHRFDIATRRDTVERTLPSMPRGLAAGGNDVAWATDDTITVYDHRTKATQDVRVPDGCRWTAVDIADGIADPPVLVTARGCSRHLYVDVGGQRLADLPDDADQYRVAERAGAVLYSKAREGGPSSIVVIGEDGRVSAPLDGSDGSDGSW
jgi:hypothetical protein